jgi:uncharacterized protein YndB with AHSA1/START domain
MSTHGTYDPVGDRPALRFERRLAHPPEKVWRAVTDPAELRHWFPAEVHPEGDTLRFVFPGGEMPPSEGRVLVRDEPRAFAFTWGADELRFELEPLDDGGTLLRFTHLFDEVEAAARDAAGWHVCFDRLEDRLGGGDRLGPSAEPTDEWRGHYATYVARGLPSGAPVPGGDT